MINWILVPVHNEIALTKRAIRTFLDQQVEGGVRVLLIDNASIDGTDVWARALHPRVIHIRKDPGLSVAASWNRGLSMLFTGAEQEHALVCNNDVELRSDTYRELLKDGGDFVTAVGNADPNCVKLPGPVAPGTRPHPDFSCFLIKKAAWEAVGPFDEKFEGAFCEDWDYHIRLHRAGIEAHCIDLPFYHVGSATIKGMNDADCVQLQAQASHNREYFRQKWGFAGASPEYYQAFGNSGPEPSKD